MSIKNSVFYRGKQEVFVDFSSQKIISDVGNKDLQRSNRKLKTVAKVLNRGELKILHRFR